MNVIKAFTREQAAKVARISPRRVSYWASKGILLPSYLYDVSSKPYRYLYSFVDVVGLRTLAILRDEHGVPLQQLRRAHEYLQKYADRPWSELRLWVRGKDVLFTDPHSRHVLSASRPGQTAIAIELEPVAMQVAADAKRLSVRSSEDVGKTERHRFVQGNRLVVKGTRVPVESIVNLAEDGYTPERIVAAYPSLTLGDVNSVLSTHQPPMVA